MNDVFPMQALKNKTVLITGASSGLGSALARAFADENANLILSARSLKLLKKMKASLKPFGIKIINVCLGAMKTNLFKGFADKRDYKTFLDPADVANIIVHCCKYPPKMNVSEFEINRMD
jgi:NADP-dependent 3-hydroxy acid dehydrogenase YdfG